MLVGLLYQFQYVVASYHIECSRSMNMLERRTPPQELPKCLGSVLYSNIEAMKLKKKKKKIKRYIHKAFFGVDIAYVYYNLYLQTLAAQTKQRCSK